MLPARLPPPSAAAPPGSPLHARFAEVAEGAGAYAEWRRRLALRLVAAGAPPPSLRLLTLYAAHRACRAPVVVLEGMRSEAEAATLADALALVEAGLAAPVDAAEVAAGAGLPVTHAWRLLPMPEGSRAAELVAFALDGNPPPEAFVLD